MSASATLTLYEILTRYFHNEQDAKAAVEAVEAVSERKIKNMKPHLLTKEDKVHLVREMKSDKEELMDRIHKAKIETIVWVVGVGVIQIALIFFSKVLF
ncbi:hypothetical protein EDD80_11721 [Anseongella ginsenosidimutans]|uniref:DUF1640 domain-containing protein n=1 Tax=Anseongella ginsenosidimutans TaxID=496056 RepID=A0A4R3KNV3_9SPHI|nr:hypothetical protein [Anseongella ginsenosidimutans]QEC52128.1 hypothetical protein FRZ59_07125 [Anseongella ginsenosidimutans]TCS84843.1 hypothetical protein EDD80_11721 [Anseongella ginsenosidimutans]